MTTICTTSPARALQIRRVVHLNGEEVEVARLAPAPTLRRVTARDEADFVSALQDAASAGLIPGSPPPSFARSLARASTEEPLVTTARLRSGIVTDLTDVANIAVVRTSFSPFTVLPGEQPRGGSAGGRPGQVHEPVEGTDAEATGLGLRVLVFDDLDHLRAWCADALTRSLTRALKRGRPQEIAATGVRRPVSASMVLIQFTDGTASQWVPMLSDGISRLAVCAAALLGNLNQDPAAAANEIAHRMLPASMLTPSSPAHGLSRSMRRNHHEFIHEYQRHLVGTGVDEQGAMMQQFLTLPANLHLLATDPASGNPHLMEPAMESVVFDQHTGVDGWVPEDDSRFAALRVLKDLVRSGEIDQDLFDLCTNRVDLRAAALLRPALGNGTDEHNSTDPADLDRLLLRRAVTLMANLLGPTTYPTLKSALRLSSNRQKLRLHHVVEFVAPLVCEPWGTLKPITRAWANGGPAPTWISNVQLNPAHPDDYLTLVDIAMDTSSPQESVAAARLELALAGGTAFIADGLLTTTLVGGSGSALAPLAFRGPVNSAVDALTHTEEGLTALALAANFFRPSRSASSARLPAIDLDQPDRVARDGLHVPVRITETTLANYAAAAGAAEEPDDVDATPPSQPTPLENLHARAGKLPSEARALLRDVELTSTLYEETGGPTGLNGQDLGSVLDSLSTALRLVSQLR